MTYHNIDIPRDRIAAFCIANHVRRLAVFGSVLRDDFSPQSDVDMLVEFESGVRVGYLAMARMTRELSLLIGRSVDLRTPAELHPGFRDEVIKEAEVQYVAA